MTLYSCLATQAAFANPIREMVVVERTYLFVPILAGANTKILDSHEKPRFCPQLHMDDHSKHGMASGEMSVSLRG